LLTKLKATLEVILSTKTTTKIYIRVEKKEKIIIKTLTLTGEKCSKNDCISIGNN